MIDLVGYRRFGHNEQDEAAYTQPLMAEQIERQPPVREIYAARLVEEGVLDCGGGRPSSSSGRSATLREAHDQLRASFAAARAAARARDPARTRAPPSSRRCPPSGSLELNEQLLRVPEGFEVNPKLAQAARAAPRGARRRRDRLGPGRGARVRVAPRGRASRSASPARTPSAARSRTAMPSCTIRAPARRTRRSRHLPEADASFEIYNSPLSEYACARLRVRLLDRGSRRARALGGAVRRLRQRRADRRRPVHRLGALEVGPDLAADAPAPARLRGQRARALERAARALPPARRAGEHPHRELHDRRRSTSTSCGGRRSTRPRDRSS